jgi:hypothetical protein
VDLFHFQRGASQAHFKVREAVRQAILRTDDDGCYASPMRLGIGLFLLGAALSGLAAQRTRGSR